MQIQTHKEKKISNFLFFQIFSCEHAFSNAEQLLKTALRQNFFIGKCLISPSQKEPTYKNLSLFYCLPLLLHQPNTCDKLTLPCSQVNFCQQLLIEESKNRIVKSSAHQTKTAVILLNFYNKCPQTRRREKKHHLAFKLEVPGFIKVENKSGLITPILKGHELLRFFVSLNAYLVVLPGNCFKL